MQDVRERHELLVAETPEGEPRVDRLCELNVIEQVRHVCETTIVQDAWARGQPLVVHGLVYGLGDGRLRDLQVSVSALAELGTVYRSAVTATRLPALAGQRR